MRREARLLRAQGHSLRAVARACGVSVRTAGRWVAPSAEPQVRSTCWRCGDGRCPNEASYAYLLGQYLGDGHLVTTARTPCLRISCADTYPDIAAEVDRALHVQSGNRVGVAQRAGCAVHHAYWKHWPCVFPQHGPGRKHERPIVLAPWQLEIVDEHPWPLIRRLVHSDGCRAVNRVVVRGRPYEYPRYFIANESPDILTIATNALDRVGVAWRYNRPNSVSVARREAVALMDEHVGPKS